ncbi:glycosyltransferase family 2 protein [Rhodophyticola sp. CCM32]|uniref:glycosyltransferase family 2 protein n=1 Tax=Rhodophyticola sp. CCM32 TaxID=2916397 RepID=UPI00107F2E8C|nr:glycosyltransferase family 2 protein [Rhodophyticola sp. CCM32]QBY02038.1 glycosyltransferase family 2 protein [Rhodophyticola sp. CCM32]
MRAIQRYGLRLRRRRFRLRSMRKSRELLSVVDRTAMVRPDDLLCFVTLRNEMVRLPYFLEYYRDRGIAHFFFVDNDSTDGTREYLTAQPDCSVWTSDASYKRARFGMDWLNWLLMKYAHGHWSLIVDPDEFLVYPFCDSRPIPALTDWLDASSVKSFGTMLLDMYPKGPITLQPYHEGQNPFEIACWFDAGNYMINRNKQFGNLWIQGGPRARLFFPDKPERAPALNKIPLVKWNKYYTFASSTHMLLPRGLNLVYDEWGGEKTSGVLMHAKFLDTFSDKASEELDRRQHYANSHEYEAYYQGLNEDPNLWCKWSERYINWRQLEILGLMSKGNWA